jgi:hypothetical protein
MSEPLPADMEVDRAAGAVPPGGRPTPAAAVPPAQTRPARLRVWSWWERDPVSHRDLAVTMAASRLCDVDAVRRRAGLHGPVTRTIAKPSEPEFTAAVARPFRLLWMLLDDYVGRSASWLDEAQLDLIRAGVTDPAGRDRAVYPGRIRVGRAAR